MPQQVEPHVSGPVEGGLMPECGGCGARLESTWLCPECCSELRETLEELALGRRMFIGDGTDCTPIPTDLRGPSFLRFLQDARLGFTRLGESERRSSENSRPALARLTSNEHDSFAGSPLELCNEIHQKLTYWSQAISGQTETLGRQQ